MADLFTSMAYPNAPGHRGRPTSRAAAEAIQPASALLRDRCLRELEASMGLTADEVAGRLGLSILSVRPRCAELARLGKIRDSGERRRNGVSGKRAIVWAPVDPAWLKRGGERC